MATGTAAALWPVTGGVGAICQAALGGAPGRGRWNANGFVFFSGSFIDGEHTLPALRASTTRGASAMEYAQASNAVRRR